MREEKGSRHPQALHLRLATSRDQHSGQRTVRDSDGSLIRIDKSENTLIADLGGRGDANSASNVVLAHFGPASEE